MRSHLNLNIQSILLKLGVYKNAPYRLLALSKIELQLLQDLIKTKECNEFASGIYDEKTWDNLERKLFRGWIIK